MRRALLLLSLVSLSACGSYQHGRQCVAKLGEFPASTYDGLGLIGALTKPADVAETQEQWRKAYWHCAHEPHHVWTADNG